MKFEILRASDKFESQTWDSIIEALPAHRRDIHFTSAYGRVQEKLGGEALLAVMRLDDAFIAQPFIKRAIPSNQERFDLCSPYGYGGPIANWEFVTKTDLAPRLFSEQLCAWCVGNRIVTEFCNLHPLFLEYQKTLLMSQPQFSKDVIIIDLNKFSEETVARRVRRGVIKARKENVLAMETTIDPHAGDYFAKVYNQSMTRKCAASRWYFPNEHIAAHRSELSARYFTATNGDGFRMLMVIGGYGTAYAHLLASNGESLHSGLDELLYCHAAKILREDGYERFHLGGGTTREPDDKLLFFKSGFSPDRWQLASYTRVFDEPEYAELTARKLADEIEDFGHTLSSDFFPIYRREAA